MRMQLLPAPPSATPAPAAPPSAATQTPPGPTCTVDGRHTCRVRIDGPQRSCIRAGPHSIAGSRSGVRIAPSTRAASHRSHPSRSSTIKSRHCSYLLFFFSVRQILTVSLKNTALASVAPVTLKPLPGDAQVLSLRRTMCRLQRRDTFSNLVGDRGEVTRTIGLNMAQITTAGQFRIQGESS